MHNENITIQKIFEEVSAISNGEGLIAPLGIKENGEIEYVDYSKINHLLVCGSSGSGKTTFVRTLLTSLMSLYSPDSVKLCIFDSKRVDYIEFNGMPHLLVPVITDSRKCLGMLAWVLNEAENRMKLLAENFNDFPDIFVVLDDYAEIVHGQYTQESLYKLLQIARSVKIHVIIVTSIALAKIISTELKVNIPHRISFFLPERRNSRVVIDQDGAEALDYPGEFIAKFYSKTNTFRSIELSDLEIKKFCKFIKSGEKCDEPVFEQIVSNWHIELIELEPEYDEDVMCEIEIQAGIEKKTFDFEELDDSHDSRYDEAVQVVLEAGQASTSLLQRRLKIGYARAVRIIDEMEENGVIGPYDGANPRKVLITEYQPTQEQSEGEQQSQAESINEDLNRLKLSLDALFDI